MINDQLKGKRVLITGASSGLGFAMAKALGLNGASLLITARNLNKLDNSLKELKEIQIDVYSYRNGCQKRTIYYKFCTMG